MCWSGAAFISNSVYIFAAGTVHRGDCIWVIRQLAGFLALMWGRVPNPSRPW
ncbi:uncharacterized protein METZ01_LOCUS26368 [marine metagenome]|uniref:Uncharacterized protein n=1 Tax=marine metagenome TaxID=408172 RepID=A0A381Q3P0_9ZZZZ